MIWYEAIFHFCGHFCHQLPARSFFIGEWQFFLCWRCSGILLGTVVFLLLLHREKLPAIKAALLFTLPMILDAGLQHIELWESSNLLRFATGLLFGLGAPASLIQFWEVGSKKFEV